MSDVIPLTQRLRDLQASLRHSVRAPADSDLVGEAVNAIVRLEAQLQLVGVGVDTNGALIAAGEKLAAQVIKLEAFKEYVHRRLDEAGVPTHPDGPHSAEGCRIGDRLDLVLAANGSSQADAP